MSVIETRIDIRGPGYRDNLTHNTGQIALLRARLSEVVIGGRDAHIRRHRERGKLLVRERIDFIVDDGSAFLELSSLAAWGQYGNEVPGAGIVTGVGMVAGRPCMFIANDATVKGGSFFHETVKKHIRAQEIAQRLRVEPQLMRQFRRDHRQEGAVELAQHIGHEEGEEDAQGLHLISWPMRFSAGPVAQGLIWATCSAEGACCMRSPDGSAGSERGAGSTSRRPARSHAR